MAEWPYNTAQWQRLRNMQLSMRPFCEPCEQAGRRTIANTVDHKVAISEGGPAFPGPDGLESMCPSCHGAKTARGGEAGAVRSSKPRKGCDADGNPLDPSHPWREKSLRADRLGPTPTENTQLVAIDTKSGGGNG